MTTIGYHLCWLVYCINWPTQPTTHTHGGQASANDKRWLSAKLRTSYFIVSPCIFQFTLPEDDLLRSKHVGVPLNIFVYFSEINTLD